MRNGFSLIEVLVVLGIITIVLSISVSVYFSLQGTSDLSSAVFVVSQAYSYAQENARAMNNDSAWGVNIATSTITVFSGNSYEARDEDFDEMYSISNKVSVSGISETIFSKWTGIPTISGTTTFTIASSSVDIFLNEQGSLSY